MPNEPETGYQTTASWAQEEASRPEHAKEVEINARLESIAAHDAADAASKHLAGSEPEKTSQTSAAVDQFERNASRKTNEAVKEGQRDVQEVQAASADYIHGVVETVKGYLPTGIVGGGGPTAQLEEK